MNRKIPDLAVAESGIFVAECTKKQCFFLRPTAYASKMTAYDRDIEKNEIYAMM